MSQRGWVGWVLDNKILAGMVALVVAVVLSGIGVVATHSSNKKVTTSGTNNTGPVSGLPGLPSQSSTVPGQTSSGPGGTVSGTVGGVPTTGAANGNVTPSSINPNVIPGAQAGPPCTPAPDNETGISMTQVRIGQIVSDVSVLPAQLKPNYYGLQAYVNLVNSHGGICGRKLVIDYSNDNASPATHDYSSMIHRDFAFVANSSLMDSQDYQSDAPFNPTSQDKGEYVPDIGGLAYSYGRNQSPWYAGNTGSLSPSLTGGYLYRYMIGLGRTGAHGPCRKAGVDYLREPTGASQDQGKLGEVALAAPWGGNLGAANVKEYVNNLDDPEPAYEATVLQMVRDGVNCVFTFSDLGSDINLVNAMSAQHVWPPDKCTGPSCFAVTYVPYAAYDPSFLAKTGDAGRGVLTWIPHVPLNETSNPSLQLFENALKTVPGATPGTFSLIGFTAGVMFAQGLEACGPAPTRLCVMTYMRELKNFTGAGLLSPVTPFRSTRVNCAGGCGNFSGHGVYNFKWIWNCGVNLQVGVRNGVRDFDRINPPQGFACDDLRVARGAPA